VDEKAIVKKSEVKSGEKAEVKSGEKSEVKSGESMRSFRLVVLSSLAIAAAPAAQSIGRPFTVGATAASLGDLRAWDARVESMRDERSLVLKRTTGDTMLEGRVHERFDQYYRGVRVFGGDLSRQSENGQAVSISGVLFPDIDLNPVPLVSQDEAIAIFERIAGVTMPPGVAPELVVLPKDEGGYALTYRVRLFSGAGPTVYFVDAHTGTLTLQYSDLKTQAAVGRGAGVLSDQQKVSATQRSGRFVATDRLRPPQFIQTYDLKGDLNKTLAFLNGFPVVTDNDLASSGDNVWIDGAAVSAHAYAGFTYDYYFKRFGRKSLNDRNLPLVSFVHPVNRDDIRRYSNDIIGLFYVNAFYAGDGVMVYGEGLPSPFVTINAAGIRQQWNFVSGALDVVAHELTHGVTEFTSDLIYRNESGALNEAFSDIMAVGAEFFFRAAGNGPLQANYTIAEDVVTPGGLRSLANPSAFGDPDHYSRRYTGTQDNGGVHINSTIPTHAFYLAIEGGTNRTSGLTVQGVGSANREQLERVMYRAFALKQMPSNANFSTARRLTIEAAQELYGAGSAVERALTQAWTAVGVN
jgi:thermolysin